MMQLQARWGNAMLVTRCHLELELEEDCEVLFSVLKSSSYLWILPPFMQQRAVAGKKLYLSSDTYGSLLRMKKY
jgi:hypothetical protein